jgi:cytochrome c-type biogenesis protein
MVAFLAGNTGERSRRAMAWLGVLVLAGVLTLMLALGVFFYLIGSSLETILPVLLPAIYVFVIAMGVLMLFGRNPFERLATVQSPILGNPYATAYLYGLLLAPMTLPCAGPVLTVGLILAANGGSSLVEQLLYFLGFGLGFGFPLILLPLLTLPLQRRFIGFLTQHHTLVTRIAGVLLVAIGLYGLYEQVLPVLLPEMFA